MTKEEFRKYCEEHEIQILDLNYEKLTQKDMDALLKAFNNIGKKFKEVTFGVKILDVEEVEDDRT